MQSKKFILAALLALTATAAQAQPARTYRTAAPTFTKTWRNALTSTTGDVIRTDCESVTPWPGTGDIPETRSWAVTIKNEDSSIVVYARTRETSGLPVSATSSVDTTGPYTDFRIGPGETWSLPDKSVLQVAIKQASGTPTVTVHFECSGTPGY